MRDGDCPSSSYAYVYICISLHRLHLPFLPGCVLHTSSPSNGPAGAEEIDVALSSLWPVGFVYLWMTSVFVGFRAVAATNFFPAPATHAARPLQLPFASVDTPYSNFLGHFLDISWTFSGHAALSRTRLHRQAALESAVK